MHADSDGDVIECGVSFKFKEFLNGNFRIIRVGCIHNEDNSLGAFVVLLPKNPLTLAPCYILSERIRYKECDVQIVDFDVFDVKILGLHHSFVVIFLICVAYLFKEGCFAHSFDTQDQDLTLLLSKILIMIVSHLMIIIMLKIIKGNLFYE